MIDTLLLCIHRENEEITGFEKRFSLCMEKFKKVMIVSSKPQLFTDFDCEIIKPFQKKSDLLKIYTGLFFSEDKEIIAASSSYFPLEEKHCTTLLKNLHKGVDCSMFYKDNELNPFYGAYSRKIIDKFKNTSAENFERTFLKRLKINKIKDR